MPIKNNGGFDQFKLKFEAMSSEESLDDRERPGLFRRAVGGCARAACSQVGLVILVVIYVLLGALLFEYLESGPEVQKRSAIQRSREECLKELWAITGQSLFLIFLMSVIILFETI